MKKRILSLVMVLAVLVIFSASISTDAHVEEGIYEEPIIEGYENINRFSCDLRISNGTAYVTARTEGLSSTVTSCSITLSIQEKVGFIWVTKDTWTGTSSGSSLRMNETYSVTSGKTYRAKATATVYTANG